MLLNVIVIIRNIKWIKNWGFDIGYLRSCWLCYNIYIYWLYIFLFFNNFECVYIVSVKIELCDFYIFLFREKLVVFFM